jgi:serine/threonine-protein kinase
MEPKSIDRIYWDAAQIASAAERDAYLDAACVGDVALRQRVEHLLQLRPQAEGFLESPAPPLVDTADESIPEHPGTQIGPYKLLEQIGEGGFGIVFMAEQLQPVRRRVALKVLKPGMDTRQVVARFEAERQALALMDHPHIAYVFDGGQTPAGRPYFVMELVRGVPITDFCDQNRLPVRDRLGLFVDVCQAVQHAHQKGVIHRDLKPTNVLVTLHDDRAVAKVIDFGVAKAMGQQLTDKTVFTNFAQMIGTPLYMSPEQAQMSGLDVDTRSDVYSLGVLLYELLTGTTPFDRERLRTAGYDELRRIIREEEPPRPSARLSTLGQAAATVSTQRQSDPRRLSQLLRGELDWIVMKCLEKDRSRRYESASSLAHDLERYLRDEPVQACPPSVWYRFRKFARRNKGMLVAAALLGIMLLAAVGAVAGSIGWAARDSAARQATTEGKATAALAEATQLQAQKRWPEALEAVKRADGILGDLGGEELRHSVQERRADLEMVIRLQEVHLQGWDVRDNHFDLASIIRQYEQAFQKYGIDVAGLEPQQAAQLIQTKSIRVELASALDNWVLARRKTYPKDADWRALLATARLADPDDERNQVREAVEQGDRKVLHQLAGSQQVADWPPSTLVLVAEAVRQSGAADQAATLLRKAQQRHPGDFWINVDLARALADLRPPSWDQVVRYYAAALALRPESPGMWVSLGIALLHRGALTEATASFKEALRLQPDMTVASLHLAMALRVQGKQPEAAEACRDALKHRPDLIATYDDSSLALRVTGQLPDAVDACRKAIALRPDEARPHYWLGVALQDQGKLPEAVEAYSKAVVLRPELVEAYRDLGSALNAQGKRPQAEAAFRKAIEVQPDDAPSHYGLGNTLRDQGKLPEAVDSYRQAIALQANFGGVYVNLGEVLWRQGKVSEAAELWRKAIAVRPESAEAHNNLGGALKAQGKPREAETAHRKAIALRPDYADAYYGLGTDLQAQGRLSEAEAAYRKAIALQPEYAEAHCNLGAVLQGQGQFTAALAERRRGNELGSRRHDWKYPSGRWVQEAEQLVALEAKLAAILRGEAPPADAAEQLLLARLCQQPYKRLFAPAARFYTAAFAAQPRLAENVPAGHRYDAACVAVLAACGKSEDQPAPHETQRGRWRQQALDWLRADLTWWQKQDQSDKPPDRASLRKMLGHWQEDADLASVRGEPALAQLPAPEREGWRRLWAEVAETLAKGPAKTGPAKGRTDEP